MTMQDHVRTGANVIGTCQETDTPLTQRCSQDVRRDLIALRVKHGATSPIGCRCSNIVELIQVPELPKALLARQMADLERLLNDLQ